MELAHVVEGIGPVALIGYAAALAVFATFCMTTMLPLRAIALLSNVLFITYGWFDGLYPVLALHLGLLPVNSWRLLQVLHVVGAGASDEFDLRRLRRLMTERRLRTGEILFRRGDPADAMFLIDSGEVEVVELGRLRGAGEIIGEMGVLSRRRRRTATVVAHSDCLLLALSGVRARELWFQRPAFAMQLMQLLTDRLIDDIGDAGGAQAAPGSPPADTA
jgi:CRP/FNR family transcriptional regulator, cyclic AMP receptor protein